MITLIDLDWSYLILSDFVDYAYYLGWGILGLIALYFLLKYIVQPLISDCLQRKAKKNAFEQEMLLAKTDELKATTDEALQKKNDELNNKVKVLEKEMAAKEILEKQLAVYKKVLNELNVDVKPKENK